MATTAKGALTPKQSRFVEEYLKDLNGTKAAIRAKYSEKTANEQAARLLAKVSVQDAIQKAMDDRSKRAEVSQDEVIDGIRETIARCAQLKPLENADGSPVLVEGPNGDLVPAVKFDATNVLKGYELLGKHLKMFTDKHEHTGEGGGPIQVKDMSKDAMEALAKEFR